MFLILTKNKKNKKINTLTLMTNKLFLLNLLRDKKNLFQDYTK